MRKRIAMAIAGLAAVVIAGGVALATPSSGVTPLTHVDRNTLAKRLHLNNDRIKFQTKGRVDTRVQTLRLAPGATTGWHIHPGFALISVTQGTQTLYSADCSSRTYSAGESFVETGDMPMVARNETQNEVVLVVTFVAPRGAPFRIDSPNPGCSVQ